VQSRRMFITSVAAGVAACWWDLASEKASACFRRKRGCCRSEACFSVQPLDDQEYAFTRTYHFTARISSNEGVTPFKVGALISGSFTYDLRGTNIHHGFYLSRRNSITFQFGDLRFSGVGDIVTVVNAIDEKEDFNIVAPDLKLPDGWEMDHTRRSQTYSFLLQNVPARKVIPPGIPIQGPSIPERISLSDFVSIREVRFDFFHGVTFPGGKITSRATVHATVESLEEVR
jgi:hypothetical protein